MEQQSSYRGRPRGPIAALTTVVVLLTATVPSHSFTGFNWQGSFTYCFQNLTAAQGNRFDDGVDTWTSRVPGLSATKTALTGNLCRNGPDLNVWLSQIDGQGKILAITRANAIGSWVEIIFDDDESWRLSATTSINCSKVDFWGTAAHEVGHAWGLHHHPQTQFVSPEGKLATMADGVPVYNCPTLDMRAQWRTLSSDDEAGGSYAAKRPEWRLPDWSFENASDCIAEAALGCEDISDYWSMTDATRDCTRGSSGSCSMKVSPGGVIASRVFNDFSYAGFDPDPTLSVRVRNSGLIPGVLSAVVTEDGDERIDSGSTCSVGGATQSAAAASSSQSGAWTLCTFTFDPIVSSHVEFEFKLLSADSNPTLWLDDIVVNEWYL